MKTLLAIACTFLFSVSLALAAQTSGSASSSAQSDQQTAHSKKATKAEKKEAKAAEKGKAMHLTGWVKEENGKTVFVNDKDKQSWDIQNPETVKGHEGHHVKVTAKLNEVDHSMNIETVKMMSKSKQSGEMKKSKKSS